MTKINIEKTLNGKFIIVELNVKSISPYKVDNVGADYLEKTYGSDGTVVKSSLALFDPKNPQFKALKQAEKKIQNVVKDNSIAYKDGRRIVATPYYSQFKSLVVKAIDEYEIASQAFTKIYEDLVRGVSAEKRLGNAYDPNRAISVEDVKEKLSVSFNAQALGDYVSKVSDPVLAEVSKDANKTFEGVAKQSVSDITDTLIDVVGRANDLVKERLVQLESDDPNGNKGRVVKQRVQDIRNSVSKLNGNNIFCSKKLDSISKETSKLIDTLTEKNSDTNIVTDNVTQLKKSVKQSDKIIKDTSNEKVKILSDLDYAFG